MSLIHSKALPFSLVVVALACGRKEEISSDNTTRPASGTSGKPAEVLANALKEAKLTGSGNLVASIETSFGTIKCTLLETKAPLTVANYVGLATGTKAWKSPEGSSVNRPAYDGTSFHRVVPGFMIQGGDAKGDGTGEPGFVIPDEIWEGAKHDHAGQLCMANRGPNTNGAQFFITDGAPKHLDGGYTIFGECQESASIVSTIAKQPTIQDGRENSKPQSKIAITKVSIARVP